MIITSKDPKHISLGRDIEKVTFRMAHLKRIMDLSQQAFRSALEIYGSFREPGPDGHSLELEGAALDHLVQIKTVLSSLQEATEAAGEEFTTYIAEFNDLEKALVTLEKKQPKPEPKPEMQVEPVLAKPEPTPVPLPIPPDSV